MEEKINTEKVNSDAKNLDEDILKSLENLNTTFTQRFEKEDKIREEENSEELQKDAVEQEQQNQTKEISFDENKLFEKLDIIIDNQISINNNLQYSICAVAFLTGIVIALLVSTMWSK